MVISEALAIVSLCYEICFFLLIKDFLTKYFLSKAIKT